MYIFDLDGTLIDSNDIWVDVDKTFLARRGMPYTKEYCEGVAHTIFPLAAVFTKEYCHIPDSTDEIMAEWTELAKDNYAHVALKPYVQEYLDRLRAQDERMAIFSSCIPDHCRTALAVHHLEPYFDQLIFAQELGMDKGDPASFRKLLELLNVSAEECTFFDDSVKSCRSAKSVGMTVIGVYDPLFHDLRDEMRSVCDRYIESFQEML